MSTLTSLENRWSLFSGAFHNLVVARRAQTTTGGGHEGEKQEVGGGGGGRGGAGISTLKESKHADAGFCAVAADRQVGAKKGRGRSGGLKY